MGISRQAHLPCTAGSACLRAALVATLHRRELANRSDCRAPSGTHAGPTTDHLFRRALSLAKLIQRSGCQLKAGVTCGGAADSGLRAMMFQCFFHGARANLSEYNLEAPTPIKMGQNDSGGQREWRYDSRELAMAEWLS